MPVDARPTLTDEQERAVARRGEPLLLSAAAGSGKTSVLVERFVRAVREDGLAPGRILAITFTERAAGELRERVRARFLELDEREAARDTEAAFVGTFHGFCARLLRAHPLMAGLDPDFAILDEGLSGRLRGLAFSAALREFLRGERSEAVDLIGAYGVDRVQAMIVSVYAQLRSQGQRLPRLPVSLAPMRRADSPERDIAVEDRGDSDDVDLEAARACGLLDELLRGFGNAYDALKQARGAVDFDDLELCAGELLDERESVRAAWSERFELLMVDEFQDTNPRQLAILHALERENLFTVGDELQSIYGFRYADVNLFRARRAELAGRGASLALTRNFRSRPTLLQAVNAVFDERFVDFSELVAGREDGGDGDGGEPRIELLLSDRSGWEASPELAARIAAGLPSAPLWRQAEARLLAQRVAELVDSGRARAGEVVVLLRAVGDLDVYERALQLHGLRTLASVGGFWDDQQVGDLLAYLRALANPLDEEALYSALASPLAGLSRDGLALLARAARAGRSGAWETALSDLAGNVEIGLAAPDRDTLESFCGLLREERASASRRTLSELLERAIAAGGYREHVLGLEWGERRLANVHKLLRLARRFESGEGRDLRGFLDHVAHLTDARSGAEPDAPVEASEPDAVRLMSIHAAKGLEFPVVCVADLGRAQNTRVGDLLVDGESVGLQLLRLDGAGGTPALDFERLCERRRGAEAEEEDRILYVAMTRARERLILSGAVDFERWPDERQGASAIAWLGPALVDDLPALVQGAEWSSRDLPLAAPLAQAAAGERPTTSGSGGRVRCVLSAPASVGAVLCMDREPERAPSSIREVARGEVAEGEVAEGEVAEGEVAEADGQLRLEWETAVVTAVTTTTTKERGVSRDPAPAATLSYTSLSQLERCGYRYYLERVLGLREDRSAARTLDGGGSLEARARGTLVHRLLESADFALPGAPSPERVASVARELGLRVGRAEREEIAGLIDAASRSAPAARVASARNVRREHPFAFSLTDEEPLVTGVIDLLAGEPDGSFLVLDYKSDRVSPELDLGALVEREYSIQRLLYALAVLREGAPSVEIVHWFLQRPHEWVGARYTAGDRATLEEMLAQRLARARSQASTFSVSAHPHRGLCLTCPGRASLCSWGEQETLREDPDFAAAIPAAGP
jgi:ATP-dependent helicase/nuclease subunit A